MKKLHWQWVGSGILALAWLLVVLLGFLPFVMPYFTTAQGWVYLLCRLVILTLPLLLTYCVWRFRLHKPLSVILYFAGIIIIYQILTGLLYSPYSSQFFMKIASTVSLALCLTLLASGIVISRTANHWFVAIGIAMGMFPIILLDFIGASFSLTWLRAFTAFWPVTAIPIFLCTITVWVVMGFLHPSPPLQKNTFTRVFPSVSIGLTLLWVVLFLLYPGSAQNPSIFTTSSNLYLTVGKISAIGLAALWLILLRRFCRRSWQIISGYVATFFLFYLLPLLKIAVTMAFQGNIPAELLRFSAYFFGGLFEHRLVLPLIATLLAVALHKRLSGRQLIFYGLCGILTAPLLYAISTLFQLGLGVGNLMTDWIYYAPLCFIYLLTTLFALHLYHQKPVPSGDAAHITQ